MLGEAELTNSGSECVGVRLVGVVGCKVQTVCFMGLAGWGRVDG